MVDGKKKIFILRRGRSIKPWQWTVLQSVREAPANETSPFTLHFRLSSLWCNHREVVTPPSQFVHSASSLSLSQSLFSSQNLKHPILPSFSCSFWQNRTATWDVRHIWWKSSVKRLLTKSHVSCQKISFHSLTTSANRKLYPTIKEKIKEWMVKKVHL